MVFDFLVRERQVLPTPEQILYGLVLAQIDQFRNDQESNYTILFSYLKVWRQIFEMMKGVDMKEPITP